jgi:regulation of enolase protein 1 (concanavalin A-like superfamily)
MFPQEVLVKRVPPTFVLRLPLLACFALLSTGVTVGAQTINITSGYLDMNPDAGPLQLGGDRGFSMASGVDVSGGIFNPQLCNMNPVHCVPGGTIDLHAHWLGNDLNGFVTLDGTTFSDVGSLSSVNQMSVDFYGTATLPPGAPSATVTAPFTLTGYFTKNAPAGPSTTETLRGTGTATLFLRLGNSGLPNSWYISRVLYVFGSTLPYPWVSADVGAVGQQGTGTLGGGSFVLQGSGADIWGAADAFQFTAQTLRGDAEIVARVTAAQNTNRFAKAGFMMRQNRDAASPHVILDVNPDGGIEFMTRSSSGTSTTFLTGSSTTFPAWLKLTRAGSTVIGSVFDGQSWKDIGSTAFASGSAYVGLAVTSHDTSVLNQSMFDNVKVSAGAPPLAPWSQVEVGAVALQGDASFFDGTFSVSGDGADIWGTADAFHYVYQSLNRDGQITARVTGERNTNTFAKAGVMLRESLTANAAHVILDVRPGGEIEFMTRSSTGASTAFIAGTSVSFPAWLRLTRNGTTVTGAVAPDGTTWTTVGATTLSIASTADIGLAVTSHDTSLLNMSTFDNVTVTAGLLAPWVSQDVGSVGTPGGTTYANGTFTVSGAGSDIWGTADAFQFVYQPMTSVVATIQARVVSEQGTSPYAKVGVMMRETLAPDAAFVILDMKPDGGIEFMQRAAKGQSVTYLGGATGGPLTWLSLVRTTNMVKASMSADGVTWTQIGLTPVNMPVTGGELGIAVTSHDPTKLNTAFVDDALGSNGKP